MTDRELMQQALEALIWTTGSDDFGDGGKAREGALKLLFPSIAALRERLAQPQRMHWEGCEEVHPECRKQRREWVGLTDEEKSELDTEYGDDTLAHLDAIEAKLKEKNNG